MGKVLNILFAPYTIFALIGVIAFIFFGVLHEKVHSIIFESYGIDSKIEYFSHFPDFVTIAEEPCKSEACILANNLNEIIGYHLSSFLIISFLGFFLVILILVLIYEKLEELNLVLYPLR